MLFNIFIYKPCGSNLFAEDSVSILVIEYTLFAMVLHVGGHKERAALFVGAL